MVKKVAADDFVRHHEGAVINIDMAGLQAYKKRKEKFREIDRLRDEVQEIKILLYAILQKL